MRRSVIFYYSGTGNTWYVANKLKHYLANNTGPCDILSIEDLSILTVKSKINNADIIGFGFPIYASDIPDPMKQFMQKIRISKEKKVMLFCTQHFFSGDGTRIATEFLNVSNEQIMWAKHFNMPNNICFTNKLKYTNDKNKINNILKKTNIEIKKFSICISQNRKFLQDFSTRYKILGNLQRPLYRKFVRFFRGKFKIDTDKCSCCGICFNVCPVDNIVYKNSKYIIKKNCALCMRCYNFCPNEAIIFNNKPRPKKYGIPYRGPTKTYMKNLIDSKRIEKIKKEERDLLNKK